MNIKQAQAVGELVERHIRNELDEFRDSMAFEMRKKLDGLQRAAGGGEPINEEVLKILIKFVQDYTSEFVVGYVDKHVSNYVSNYVSKYTEDVISPLIVKSLMTFAKKFELKIGE